MKASYDGSIYLVKTLLNAGAKTDLQNKVHFVDFEFGMEKRTHIISEMFQKVMVPKFGIHTHMHSYYATGMNN